jgi:predicted enzyme related to lactoylglutathione lyase
MSRVTHFEIPADDPERAIRFYSKVFGWKIKKWEGPVDYWLVTTGSDKEPGINGAIMKKSDPAMSVINSIDVKSVDAFLKKVIAAGGKTIMPKTPIPGVGYFAYCQDTEGNMFGMMQSDKSVK